MFVSSILYIFVFLILLIIFMEYKNNKKYQAKRDEERKKTTTNKPIQKIPKEKKIPQEKPEPHIEEKPKVVKSEVEPEAVEEVQTEEAPEEAPEVVIEEVQAEIIEEVVPTVVEEEVAETKELPSCQYPPFTHVRLVEMGLSDDEATEFVNELIPQLEEQVPLIEVAINSADFHQVERLTHGIKGSSTNLGTGGVSDFLVEFNTYLKSGTDADIIKAYHAHFIHYIEELKKQYA